MKLNLRGFYALACLIVAAPFVIVGLVLAYMTQACAYMVKVLTEPAREVLLGE